MRKTKHWLMTMAVLLCSMTASAHDFEVDGIYYNITSSEDLTVEVTFQGNYYTSHLTEYSGSVIIPDTVVYGNHKYAVTAIRQNAFDSCSGLTSVTIPNSIKEIGQQAFARCENLSDVYLPDSSVEVIESEVFALTALTKVTIPNSVKTIRAYAFVGCEELSEISIPKSVTEIAEYAFNGCTSLPTENYIRYADTWAVGTTDKNRVRYTLRENTTGLAGTFQDCVNLTNITLPDSLKYIGDYAFYNCCNLKSFNSPSYVVRIGYRAFLGCTSLTEIKIPAAVADIGYEAFRECSNLVSVEFPTKLREISEAAFYKCGLISITLPDSITEIKENTFLGNNFSEVILPEGITDIREGAFMQCLNLTKVTLPETLINVEAAFSDCPISSIIIPESVERIVFNAFSISKSVTLNSPEIYAQGNFKNRFGEDVREYVFGVGIKEIEDYKLANYTNLKSVILPDSLTTIGEGAFEECISLDSMTIPTNVTRIKDYAFSNCTALKHIVSKALVPPTCDAFTFNNVDTASCILEVPVSVVNAYATTKPWSDFNIKVNLADSVNLENDVCTMVGLITYTRNFRNTNWQALYVPFEIPVTEEFLADFEVADLNDIRQYDRDDDGVKDETVVEAFKVTSGALEANYPYLIRAREAGEKTIAVADATLYPTEENSIDCSSVHEKYTFTGTYNTLGATTLAGCYALSGGVWQPVAEDASLGAFRFYLKIENRDGNAQATQGIKMRVIGDDTTKIDNAELENESSAFSAVYDLQGRRVVNPTKGVYIVNGKKVLF